MISGTTSDGLAPVLLHDKKRQRLLQKAATRPSEAVMASATLGIAQIGQAPKVSDFKALADTHDERLALHAAAMLVWAKQNVSKTGILQETRVRATGTRRAAILGRYVMRF